MGDDEEEEEDDGGTAGVPSLKQQLLRRQKNMETNLPCRSMTPRKVIQLINKDYGFLPFDDEKPCLFVVSLFEDIRKRLFHSNLLNKIAENLVRIGFGWNEWGGMIWVEWMGWNEWGGMNGMEWFGWNDLGGMIWVEWLGGMIGWNDWVEWFGGMNGVEWQGYDNIGGLFLVQVVVCT